jgi:hypothetical protein
LSDADEAVRLGMTAGVKFAGEEEPTLLLPTAAVTQRDGKSMVWVVNAKNQVEAQFIETGAYREDGVLVTAGLSAGAQVVVAGVHTLTQGQVVRPMLAGAKP